MKILIDKKNDKDLASCGLDDEAIRQAVKEIANGMIDVDLGGGLIKKRIARGNRGKSKGCRGLIVLQSAKILVLVHVFPKGSKSNISMTEKKSLLKLAKGFRDQNPDEILAMAEREKWRTIENDP